MIEIENVLSNYVQTKAEHALVPGKNISIALQALRLDIPNLLSEFVSSAGYNLDEFYIHASAGQPNRSFAKVPWIAIFKRSITKSAQQGYYIVILFSEDMTSVSISLNQGYTSFGKRYGSPELAYKKLRDCARAVIGGLATLPSDFFVGPIDLHTDGELAKGYEAGSILAKSYTAGSTPSKDILEQDIHNLLHVYLILANQHPSSLINLDVDVDATDFNEAVERVARDAPEEPSSIGPQSVPPKGINKGISKYVRSTDVASRALAMSKSVCELSTDDDPHLSFISARSKKNYVEAHHLVPFSQQLLFPNSLDVEENIVALCANCHKKLHYGIGSEKAQHLKFLLGKRELALKERGINIAFDELKLMYRVLTNED